MDFPNNKGRQDMLEQPMRMDGEVRHRTNASKRISIAVGLLIVVAGFAFNLNLELKMRKLGVFNQLNIMFDADPGEVLLSIADGGGGGYYTEYRRGIMHPNMGNFFTVPIRALVDIRSMIIHDNIDKRDLRQRLALLVIPLSAALFYLVFYVLLLHLGFSLPLASLFTLLAFVSFSQMLFGSLPETYGISNLAIALAYLLFVISRGSRGMHSFIAWIAVGMFAAGITITNIVPVMILFWLREIYQKNGFARSIIKTSKMVSLILMLTFTLNVAGNVAIGYKQRSLSQEVGWIKGFNTKNIQLVIRKFFTFPTFLVYSIIAPVPKQLPNVYAIKVNPTARYTFRFTYDFDEMKPSTTPPLSLGNLAGVVLCLLILLPVLLPAQVSPYADRSILLLSWGSLLIICFNWVLHSVWGTDRMLYSQHWIVSMIFLFAVLVTTQLRSSLVRTVVVAASVILVAANNLLVVRAMLMALSAG
jgi:hypothetical protein